MLVQRVGVIDHVEPMTPERASGGVLGLRHNGVRVTVVITFQPPGTNVL